MGAARAGRDGRDPGEGQLVDEYNWGGAAGTGFWIDPKEALICLIMTQTVPGPAQRYDRALVRHLVYQVIIE